MYIRAGSTSDSLDIAALFVPEVYLIVGNFRGVQFHSFCGFARAVLSIHDNQTHEISALVVFMYKIPMQSYQCVYALSTLISGLW